MKLVISGKMVRFVGELERFRGSWKAYGGLPTVRLGALEETVWNSYSSGSEGDSCYRVLLEALVEQQGAWFPTLQLVRALAGRLSIVRPGASEAVGPEQEKEKLFALEELLASVRKDLEGSLEHPLLVAACFFYRFLLLNPCASKTPPVGLLLLRLLLLKCGYQFVRYMEVETAFVGARGLLDAEQEEGPWIELFLETLAGEKRRVTERLLFEQKLLALSDLEERIVSMSLERPRVSISDIEEVTQVGRNTLKPRLRSLVKQGHLEQHGKGKGTWYSSLFQPDSWLGVGQK
jgi:hypothetical protein